MERGPSGPLFFALFLLLSAASSFAAEPALNWDESPEAYFATAEELSQWERDVISATDAEKFIEEFRRKRGPQFQRDLAARIAAADKNFALAKIPGSRTARGRVFILLGPPNEQRADRASGTGAAGGALGGSMQDNSMERGARAVYRWVYRSDRLPAELGRRELIIDFQTDVSRGTQHIENPGVVEPVLRKAATLLSEKYFAQAAAAAKAPAPAARPTAAGTAPSAAAPTAASTPDPLWQATPAPNGAIYTGDAFTSATAKPFYAFNVFVPAGTAGLSDAKSAQVVTLVRDANGKQVVSDRSNVDLRAYAGGADRYLDRGYELAPGKYDALVALYSADGSRLLSSWRESFEVPAAGTPRASKLFLASSVTELEKQQPFEPFTFVATKYAIRGDRKFSANDTIALFATIDNPSGSQPKLMQKMTFTRDGKPSFKTSLEPAQLQQAGPNTYLVGVNFPAGAFKPGHYTVELQLRDFNAPEGSELRTKGYVLTSEFDVK